MFLQLCPVIHRSLNKADDCWTREIAGKNIKLEEHAISEIQVADTDWESDAEASDAENYFEEEEEEQQQQQQLQASPEVEPQAATSGWLPTWGLPQRRNTNIHPFCQSSKRWTMKQFFHLLDLTVLNSWILLSSCGAKYTHRDFRFLLVRKLTEEEDSQDRPNPRLVIRPSVGTKNVLRLESRHNKRWPVKSSTQMRCCLCASRSQRKGTVYKCTRCDVGLFNVPCFMEYHTKVNL